MTSKNPINYAEVLKNHICGTTSKSSTQYTLSRLEAVKKYIFVSNMGNIDRIYGKIDAELQSANAYMKAILTADDDADAKGGYGRGSQDLVKEFGFEGGEADLHIRIEDLVAIKDVIEEFYNSNNHDFETAYGYAFKGSWIGQPSTPAKSPLTSKQRADLKKKYLEAQPQDTSQSND